jgi:hypothetical protein
MCSWIDMQLESADSFEAAIRTIEAELRIQYPKSAPQLFSDLSAIIETSPHLGNARLLVSSAEVAALKTEVGSRLMDGYLLPFLREGEGRFPNIYGYDLADPARNRIAIYRVHTIVHDWPSPQAFLKSIKKYS